MAKGMQERGRIPEIVAMTVTSGAAGMVTVTGSLTTDDGVPVVLARRPIAEAPKDGTVIRLYSATVTHGIQAYWRKTGQRTVSGGRWVQNAFWASPVTNTGLGMGWTEWDHIDG